MYTFVEKLLLFKEKAMALSAKRSQRIPGCPSNVSSLTFSSTSSWIEDDSKHTTGFDVPSSWTTSVPESSVVACKHTITSTNNNNSNNNKLQHYNQPAKQLWESL